ncbi:MAG: glycolate oxidase subunit GlcD [Deltaproteobacteria bacterium RBG_16_47_11]|nr:MAG: glycolate oxidase subunit GlcD [Deltaproteobacteria bacterium RBG_16_47_11]
MNQANLIQALTQILGQENVLTSETDLAVYGYDGSLHSALPDVIVLPKTTEQVSAIVSLASKKGVPIVARGSGTNLSGGSIPLKGGIVIHFSRMNKILEIDIENQRAVVEAGVINLDLQNALSPYGYYFAPDPASQKVSTMAGNLAENAGGPHCLKYGVTTNHVLGAEIVLPNGEVLGIGGKASDYSSYDLLGVLVGSEGTLGIVTKMIVRIIRKPESVQTFLAIFDSLEGAGNAVSAIIGAGIIPATLEMMDRTVIKAIEESIHAGYPLDAEAVLIIELDGIKDGMGRLAQRIEEICKRNHVREVKRATSEAEQAKLWEGRKGALGALARLKPNYLLEDGTVPRTKLPGVLKKVVEIGKKYQLEIGIFLHAGDGNFHPTILFDARNEDERKRVLLAGTEILEVCVEAGGTLSGEHGIGIEKIHEMSLLFSPLELESMRHLKGAFDPREVFNPGKLIPENR